MTPSAADQQVEALDARVAAQKAANGEALLLARRRRRLSQAEVAQAAGTDQKVVSRAELGKASMETQHRIAAALDVSLEPA